MNFTVILSIAGGILAFLTAVMLFRLMHLRNRERQAVAGVVSRTAPGDVLCIDKSASWFGRQSQGMAQIRGNGVLVLTRDTLWFRRLAPELEITIPLESIREVSTPRSFLGKSIFRQLLRVDFVTSQGHSDAAAWYVRELECFAARLGELCGK